MTVEDFLDRYPEFGPVHKDEPTLIPACLVEATEATSDAWGGKRDQVIGLETAHRAAITPIGRNAKLSSGLGKTTYSVQLKKMKTAFGCGLTRQA